MTICDDCERIDLDNEQPEEYAVFSDLLAELKTRTEVMQETFNEFSDTAYQVTLMNVYRATLEKLETDLCAMHLLFDLKTEKMIKEIKARRDLVGQDRFTELEAKLIGARKKVK